MSKPIFYQCQVLDNQDPLMLGRVRARLIVDNYDDITRSFTNPPWNEEVDRWTQRDPFIFSPLLPYFVYQVPKVDEMVQIIYVNSDFEYQNQYYVQNTFFSPTSSNFQNYQGANKFTGTGRQIKGPKELKNKTDGTLVDSGVHKGVFPEPGDNAILGRGSADLIVKENDVLLRAGKFIGESLQPNIIPAANNQRGFLQLSRFQSVSVPQEPKTIYELNNITVLVKYLIEWTIINPENNENKFSGAVYLYQLKPDVTTNSENITVDSFISENLKTLVTVDSFNLLSKQDTILFINNFIKTCNDSTTTKTGLQLFNDNNNKFPIFYRPNIIVYKKMTGNNSSEVSNILEIFNQIKLLPPLKQGGYGLIYKFNSVGKPTEIKETVITTKKSINSSTTYGAIGSDKFFLLSYFSKKIGKDPINFSNTLYGISSEVFIDEILPKTSSMVRGEELMELLNLIVRYLITHTHAYPGLPPVSITQDGTSVSDILTEMQNAVNKILNENIRLN